MDETAEFDPDAVLKQAMAHHGAGRFREAEQLYRQLLHRYPSHIDLLNVVGALYLQMGEAAKAVPLLGRSLGFKPDQPEVLVHRGMGLQALGHFPEALDCYARAMTLTPPTVAILSNMGFVLMALGRGEEAAASYGRAIALAPQVAEGYYNRGTVLLRLKRAAEALADFDRTLEAQPDSVPALVNRGTALLALDRPEEALPAFDRASALAPDCAEAFSGCGNARMALKQSALALQDYDKAVALAPADADIHYDRGNALMALKRYAEALSAYDAALARNPRSAEAYNNRGNALIDLDRPEEALASLNRALAIDPKHVEAYANRGNVLRELNRPEEALASFDRALALAPDYAEAHANKSVALLHLGRFAEGWKAYEWRWKCEGPNRAIQVTSDYVVRRYAQSIWLGDAPIAGKTVLIHAEQGFGDNIQFCRYVPMVADLGATVILQMPAPLLSLMSTLRGDITLVEAGASLPPFDLHCPIMSLPCAFGTTLDRVPADVPYLYPDAAKRRVWQERLGERQGLRVGLAWSGNPQHSNDRNRSLPLEVLKPLLSLPCEFHVLQKDIRSADAAMLAALPRLQSHAGVLKDFSDTAALISEMDLVISVDTSVAHVAGALGKPVWLLLTWVSEWRWLMEREDSPWYPTARLLRQGARGDWAGVVAEAAARLSALAAAK